MKTITVEQLLDRDPCYSESKIRALAGDKTKWTALEILTRDDVPATDRLWVVLDESLIDAPILHEFACQCAERVLHLTRDKDSEVCRNAIDTKRRWLRGDATDEELFAARDAAWAAARAAAWAARDAAWAAAWAARDAAWAAAWAARAATWDAVWAAAGDAAAVDTEREAQVELLIELLKENDHV